MENTDSYSHESNEMQSAERGGELNVSQVQPARIEHQDAHWLRMDPSLTKAALAKTEEELLGSLAALMRNKVEHEQASRKFAQTQIDTEEARRELEAIKAQVRRTEEEVATRLNEQSRISEEIIRVRQELTILREGQQRDAEIVSSLRNEAATLAETLSPLREEVDDRIRAREALIADAVILHQHVSDLAAQKVRLQGRLHELAEIAKKAEQVRAAEGLPLLFGGESYKVAPEWDPYPLESEFHTDEVLDARKVAELVSQLPGLEGCLIVKNRGSVLASQIPERIHPHLKVPSRNYELLFERLEKKVAEYNLQNAHLATFDLGGEALTVAQANQAFVFVSHKQARLRPGMPGKLASIVSEVAKMYP